MNQSTYQVQFSPFDYTYTFTSVGKHGPIQKIVQFTNLQEHIFNLGFGDLDPVTDTIDDKVVSDNGDMRKVLATVITIINVFLQDHPSSLIYIEGSSVSRTRLYQMAINIYFDDFSQYYQIWGLKADIPEPFQKNVQYESFLIQKLL